MSVFFHQFFNQKNLYFNFKNTFSFQFSGELSTHPVEQNVQEKLNTLEIKGFGISLK